MVENKMQFLEILSYLEITKKIAFFHRKRHYVIDSADLKMFFSLSNI